MFRIRAFYFSQTARRRDPKPGNNQTALRAADRVRVGAHPAGGRHCFREEIDTAGSFALSWKPQTNLPVMKTAQGEFRYYARETGLASWLENLRHLSSRQGSGALPGPPGSHHAAVTLHFIGLS
jgi:hypothetical protein